MDAHPKFGELCHCGADIHHIAAEPIELGDHQHVTGFEAIKEAREPAPLRGSDISGCRLSDHTPGLDLEAGCRDLLQLVVRRLAGGGHAKIGKGARHRGFRPKTLSGTYPLSKSL